MIYLDNAATTKIHPEVLTLINQVENQNYFNATTKYSAGAQVYKLITQAEQSIKNKLHGENGSLIFTSGATESNLLIINQKIRNANHHLIITAGDHNSVYLPAKDLANKNFNISTAPLCKDGQIDIPRTLDLITDKTTLFVFSLVNSDTGTFQDVQELIKQIKEINPKVHIHCDMVQAFCKFDVNVQKLGIDSATLSAHKINGPKGVGALWVKKGITPPERHGTYNNSGILGFAKAVEIFSCPQVFELHKQLVDNLTAGCQINGINNNPYITNISLPNVYGDTVLNALSSKNIFVGVGSACNTSAKNNRTLSAMGLSPEKQKQVIRVSLGINNTQSDIKTFLEELQSVLNFISPNNITK